MSAEDGVVAVDEFELPEDFDESQFEDPDDFVDEISDEGQRVACSRTRILESLVFRQVLLQDLC